MCNVRNIDGLIAIVSADSSGRRENKKVSFTSALSKAWSRWFIRTVIGPLKLKEHLGMCGVHEEHILQICEAFAGCVAGRADILRRALAKQKQAVIEEVKGEFVV